MVEANRLLFSQDSTRKCKPQGKIKLDVFFGDSGNFRREKLEFEVMDWPSQYHAIVGRPTFAKFMAVPHYAYLALKILGPRGATTVKGSSKYQTLATRNSIGWRKLSA
jgi:hypothetical protein